MTETTIRLNPTTDELRSLFEKGWIVLDKRCVELTFTHPSYTAENPYGIEYILGREHVD